MATLTDKEFRAKHSVNKPFDLRDRDMTVASNLSDIQTMVGMGQVKEVQQRCNALKSYIFDTTDGENYRDLNREV